MAIELPIPFTIGESVLVYLLRGGESRGKLHFANEVGIALQFENGSFNFFPWSAVSNVHVAARR